jgi:O-antigen ligase
LIFCWFGIADPKASKGRRAFWLLLTGPMLFAALKTGSRTAVVCFVLTGIYFFFRLPAQRKLLVAFFIPPVLVTTVFLLPAELRTRLATITVREQAKLQQDASELERAAVASTEGRWYLLQRSITVTLQNPILGVGPNNFMVAESQLSEEEGLARGMWRVAHNGYTQVSSEMGVPGLFFYLAAIGSTWFSLRRWAKFAAPRPECADFLHIVFCLQLALFSLLVDIFFGLSLYSYFVPALLGLAVALDRWASTATWDIPQSSASPPRARNGRPVPAAEMAT